LREGDGVTPPELMRALNGAPGDPTNQDIAGLASALGGALGVALPLPGVAKALQAGTEASLSASATVGASGAKPLAALGAWVAGGLALGAGLSAVAYSFASVDGPAPQARPAVTVTAAVSKPALAAPQGPLPAPREPIADVDRRAITLPTTRAASTPSAPESAPTPEREISLLKRAREATLTNPAQALVLTSEHAKLFPGGALAQEREVIAIDALLRLGRQAEAAQRAQRFQSNYPGSAHARRLSTLFMGG
jgi:hypothetical protein